MASLAEPLPCHEPSSPLHFFTGPIDRTRISPLYTTGLAIVAFAMVLLPLIYVGLIAFTAWGVLWHLQHDTWLLGGSGGHVWRFIAYVGPAIAGGILIFFMVKPFFAKRPKAKELLSLNAADEALLFGFVNKICSMVGAPAPCRIDVDCEVNASARLRGGFLSRELVLTVGLPLVSGLDMRQFAGVLAHEFGHFAQGAGMRLTYVIRHINLWFARVVYERDDWDLKLDKSAHDSDFRIGIVLHLARGCIWLSRRILWLLMHAGTAISCFMLRQMEYDADSYEAKIAGSDTFESTALRLRELGLATQRAYETLRQSWAGKRVPNDLPLLIAHYAGSLPANVREKISSTTAAGKTSWFDTHPCDADRVRHARQLDQPGVFRLNEPATALFHSFADVCQRVTRQHYENDLELDLGQSSFISGGEILAEATADAEAQAAVAEFFGEVHPALKPLFLAGQDSGISALERKWQEARQTALVLRPEAEVLSRACVELQQRRSALIGTSLLLEAGFKIDPAAFGLPAVATSKAEQEAEVRQGLQQTSAAIEEKLKNLEPFMAALRERVSLALQRLLSLPEPARPKGTDALPELLRAAGRVGSELEIVHQLGSKLGAFVLLMDNRANHADPAQVDRPLSELAREFRGGVGGLQERLSGLMYPFPHARGQVSLAEYLRCEQASDHAWVRSYQEAEYHVRQLLALHHKLIGRILVLAAYGEKTGGPAEASALSNASPLR